MSKVPAALATLTWLEVATLPVPLSASVPPLMVVTPVYAGAGQRLGACREREATGAADDAGVGSRPIGDRQGAGASVTLLLATPLSVVMVAPAAVPEMLNMAPALATLTWLDDAMLPVSASVPPLMVVAPV